MEKAYCARLGIAPPRVEDHVHRKGANLRALMIIALLERGGKMTVERIAERLRRAGVRSATGDLVYSLRKAWHGLKPVYKDAEGRYGLELSCHEMKRFIFRHLRERRPPSPPPAPVEEPPLPDIDGFLSMYEVEAAAEDGGFVYLSDKRQVAALLDASGGTMPLGWVNAELSRLYARRSPIDIWRVREWRTGLVTSDEEGLLRLDHESSELPGMRRAIRRLARKTLARRARQRAVEAKRAEVMAAAARRRIEARREARTLKRAILRAVPEPRAPRAAAFLDLGERSFRSFLSPEFPALLEALGAYDLLAGIRVCESLEALGLDPNRWRLVDLAPPRKTKRLNRRGRTLKITSELLIRGSTRIRRPLGEPARMARYLAEGEFAKLERRLASDLKALAAYYRYGILHGAVRLRWGFLDEFIPVQWRQPGDPSAYAILREAQERGASVQIVWGTAPGWKDPWSRAIAGRIEQLDPDGVDFGDGVASFRAPREEIQAVRIVEEGDGSG